jgi:hypothetical protein
VELAYAWFSILLGVCVLGPYFLGVRPRSRAEWMALTTTIAFLVWLLLFMTPLRSR